MKILNFGSLNIDHVYQVDHFVRAGGNACFQRLCQAYGWKRV